MKASRVIPAKAGIYLMDPRLRALVSGK
ncbi:MAG: hypothetical protein ACD_46C00159G0010, partial [uncultured bacterium]